MIAFRFTRGGLAPIAALLAVGALGAVPAAASAASTMTIQAPSSGNPTTKLDVTVSGVAERGATVTLFMQSDATPCASTVSAEFQKPPGAGPPPMQIQFPLGTAQVAAGPYSLTATTQGLPGSDVLCGYLSVSQSAPPDAAAQSDPVHIVGDTDGDGLYDDTDKCPTQAGINQGTSAKTADGCPKLDPDRDGLAGDDDQCPTQPSNGDGQTGGADAAHPGCPKAKFKVYYQQRWDTFRGVAKPGTIPANGHAFFVMSYGFDRAVSFRFSVTLSKATAKAAGITKREIAAATVPLVLDNPQNIVEAPKPSSATLRKLRAKTFTTATFEWKFVVLLQSGATRTRIETHTLKKGRVTNLAHAIIGQSASDGGENQ